MVKIMLFLFAGLLLINFASAAIYEEIEGAVFSTVVYSDVSLGGPPETKVTYPGGVRAGTPDGRDIAISFTFLGGNKFKLLEQEYIYAPRINGVYQYQEPEIKILSQKEVVLTEQYTKIGLTSNIPIYAKMKPFETNRAAELFAAGTVDSLRIIFPESILPKLNKLNSAELYVTRDVTKYVDISIEDARISGDYLTFEICNRGNEPFSTEHVKGYFSILPNFIEGGSENVNLGEPLKKSTFGANECEEYKVEIKKLAVKPEQITRILISLNYQGTIWYDGLPIDIFPDNNRVEINVEDANIWGSASEPASEDSLESSGGDSSEDAGQDYAVPEEKVKRAESKNIFSRALGFFKRLFG